MIERMLKRYLLTGLAIIGLCVATTIHAEESVSAILNEADKLIEITPERSKKIAQKFLTSRSLTSNNNEQVQNHVSRGEPDNSLRTPRSSIKALQIIAKATYRLGNSRTALVSMEQAEVLARTYQLPYLLIEVQILKTRLTWNLTGDKNKIQPLLIDIGKQLKDKENTILAAGLHYQLLMLKADIAASSSDPEGAEDYYKEAGKYLPTIVDPVFYIKHQLTLGEFYLSRNSYNQALDQLLSAYWSAIEKDQAILLAKINHTLAKLFYDKSIFDKALEHLSQAADFYDNYEDSQVLSRVLKMMADIYFSQGRYNLALVHYFNVLDSEVVNRNIEDVIELRLSLANTYLQLYNYPLSEQYLQSANILLTYTEFNSLKALAFLLTAKLEYQKHNVSESLDLANNALEIGQNIDNSEIQIGSHLLLTEIYESLNNFEQAHEHGKVYNKLITEKQDYLLTLSENDFREQKLFIERSLHYKDQSGKLAQSKTDLVRFRYATVALFFLSLLILSLFLRRGVLNRRMKKQLSNLYKDHYTHPRSD